jgi:hypothetical protein
MSEESALEAVRNLESRIVDLGCMALIARQEACNIGTGASKEQLEVAVFVTHQLADMAIELKKRFYAAAWPNDPLHAAPEPSAAG